LPFNVNISSHKFKQSCSLPTSNLASIKAFYAGWQPPGNLIRKAGIMGIILRGSEISVNDVIRIKLPELPFIPLERV
jgi:hypothetical protein